MKVLIFGDSITQGLWDSKGGWAHYLKQYYDKRDASNYENWNNVFVLGISGETSSGVLGRFQNEIESRIKPHHDFAIVFATGVNDSRITNGEPEAHIGGYSKNMQTLIDTAKKYTDRVLVVGLTPVIDKRTNPISWIEGIHYNQQRVLEFDSALKIVSEANNVPYVDVMNPILEANKKDDLLPDGIHPETKGHKLMYKVIKKELEKVLK